MLNKRIISFKTINTPHSGKNRATLINDEIIDLGIRDKIFIITLDNASNNDAIIQRLKSFWQIKEDHAKLFHVRCCAHILNLSVKDGLKQVDSILEKLETWHIILIVHKQNMNYFFIVVKLQI